jgi:hypothetical protein
VADLTIEVLKEMRERADGWLHPRGEPEVTRDNALAEGNLALDVIELLDALEEEQSTRSEIADSRLDLIFKIHRLAEEYVGPRPIDAQPEEDLEAIEDSIAGAQSERDEYRRERDELRDERDRLQALINTPRTDDFFDAVRIEAAHQVERWGTEHDAGKRAEDWIALLTYLTGKAPRAYYEANAEKMKHHIVTIAAVCLNWLRNVNGESTLMRPGVAPRDSEFTEEASMARSR